MRFVIDDFVRCCTSVMLNVDHLQVKLLRYVEETEEIQCAALYHHTGEVLSIASSASDVNLISTVYDTVPVKKGTVWRLPPLSDPSEARTGAGSRVEPNPQELVAVADVPEVQGLSLHSLLWAPTPDAGAGSTLAAVFDGGVRAYSLGPAGGLQQTGAAQFEEAGDSRGYIGGAAWDPHHPGEVAVAIEGTVHMLDLRSGDTTRTLPGGLPPGGVIRGITYNPNRPWFMATGGDDFRVKCWDVRKPVAPVKVLEGHAHW